MRQRNGRDSSNGSGCLSPLNRAAQIDARLGDRGHGQLHRDYETLFPISYPKHAHQFSRPERDFLRQRPDPKIEHTVSAETKNPRPVPRKPAICGQIPLVSKNPQMA